ncbi:DUF7573 domain-containing protein [Halomarina litorea]|uniref:DUF7573 domain-containing protein n=1 Tax=Halomarina litorea TaxID=2961595 RepID=UPI0020C509B5|nr:hypothetical protein [Halomarina sp. BCD28]
MSPDRSLDDFLGPGEDDGTDDGGGDETTEDSDPVAESGDPTGTDPTESGAPEADAPAELVVRPARSTMDWTPGGAPCEACGASADRRWRDGDRLVCADCKEW